MKRLNQFGNKLLITGKGRCNITNNIDISEFIKNIPGNGKFLYSVFNNFDNKDIIKILESNGLKTKVERGNRIFPITDLAIDVLNVFKKVLKNLNVEIIYSTKVEKIMVENNKVIGVFTNKEIKADKVIIATGGLSYSKTGSSGDGYNLAKQLGHNIIKQTPSLVPLETDKLDVNSLQGLSLKNVKIKFLDISNEGKEKIIYEDFGEMLFTHFGVSGPIILSGSAYLLIYKNIEDKLKQNKIKLVIDLKPGLNFEQLDLRILRDFEELKNKQFKNSLEKLLPKKIIPVVIAKTEIDENKKVNEITKEERKKLVSILKGFEFYIKNPRPIEEAIITKGGIDIKQINPKTMESKIINGLFFAGEIIDVDGFTRRI